MNQTEKMIIQLCLFVTLLHTGACGTGKAKHNLSLDEEPEIPIRVLPSVELFSTIHRLAGTGQYDENKIPVYINKVEQYFGQYKDHEAVQLAIELRETHGLNGNSPMALAVYLTDPPDLNGRAPLDTPPEDLDSRWTAETISQFMEAARKFAMETEFNVFFEEQKSYYKKAISNLQSALQGRDILPWFQDYFGYRPDDYVIILGLQNGSCNYGSSVTLKNGKREFQSLLGATNPDKSGAPQYPAYWYIPTIVHEFCHSYVNPLVDKNKDSLKEAGETMFPYHKEDLKKSGYNYWHVMMYEYLTRACVVRYLYDHEGDRAARERMKYDINYGFPAIRGLVDLLEVYENRREEYPNLDVFLPEIIAYFNQYAKSLR